MLAQTARGFTVAPLVATSASTTTKTTTTLLEKDGINSGGGRGGDRRGDGGRRGKTLGPNGHDYNLSQDAGPSVSVLPEPEIHRLIAERLQWRLNRDFVRADSILAKLSSAGVRLDDGRREWRADGQGFGKADPNRPYKMKPDAGPNLSILPETQIHLLVAERLQCKMSHDFSRAASILKELHSAGVTLDDGRREWKADASGPNVHNYNMSQDAGPSVSVLPEPEIHRLIAERLQCKTSRDFLGMDSIREKLFAAGVMLDDYRKEWRADAQGLGKSYRDRSYDMSPEAGPSVSILPESEIQSMIRERWRCQMSGDFPKADSIRVELHSAGVRLHDSRREWRADEKGFGDADPYRQYEMSTEAGPSVSVLPEPEIHRLVAEIWQCRLRRDFRRADSIREELSSAGVMLNDGLRVWRADGQGFVKADPKRPYELSPAAGPSVSVLPEPEIHRLIAERLLSKLSRDFPRADSIRAELLSAGVRLDDGRREWRADGQGFVRANRQYEMSPGAGPSVSVLPEPEIHRLIAERLQCKMNRDFPRADSILEELSSAGVRLDDYRKRWRADGQQGILK
jgi:cysteinyl-tRNA synthetase